MVSESSSTGAEYIFEEVMVGRIFYTMTNDVGDVFRSALVPSISP